MCSSSNFAKEHKSGQKIVPGSVAGNSKMSLPHFGSYVSQRKII
jgi:hypothetical protein